MICASYSEGSPRARRSRREQALWGNTLGGAASRRRHHHHPISQRIASQLTRARKHVLMTVVRMSRLQLVFSLAWWGALAAERRIAPGRAVSSHSDSIPRACARHRICSFCGAARDAEILWYVCLRPSGSRRRKHVPAMLRLQELSSVTHRFAQIRFGGRLLQWPIDCRVRAVRIPSQGASAGVLPRGYLGCRLVPHWAGALGGELRARSVALEPHCGASRGRCSASLVRFCWVVTVTVAYTVDSGKHGTNELSR